jgi:hypothetical protein
MKQRGTGTVSEEAVRHYAKVLGYELPPERAKKVASLLQDIGEQVATLDETGLADIAPAVVFRAMAGGTNGH